MQLLRQYPRFAALGVETVDHERRFPIEGADLCGIAVIIV